ncbi:MAG: hypothetical protein FWE05_08225 [Defluviitaleaceae bacterium]|nr:hypothetical protein [Defluviitaleaceae bacterium]
MKFSLIKYNLDYFIRTPHYLPPLLLFVAFFAFNYQMSPIGIWSNLHITSIATFILANWIATGFMASEDKTQQYITRLHVHHETVFHLSKIASILIFLAPLWLTAVFFPIVTGMFPRSLGLSDLIVYVVVHFLFSLIGTAVGVFFNSDLFFGEMKVLAHLLVVSVIAIPFHVIFEDIQWITWVYYLLPPINFLAERFYYLGEGVFIFDGIFFIFVAWALAYTVILVSFYIFIIKKMNKR